MPVEIQNYSEKMIQKQVDLIWDVTGKWRHPYATSYDSIKRSYASEDFDPSTRFYAVDRDELLGYLTSAVAKDQEGEEYGTLRFPVTKNNDMDLATTLIENAERRFKELGISKIRAPAGEGMGNTIELAKNFGFEQVSALFKRSKISIEDLKISGNGKGTREYDEEKDYDTIKSLFSQKMGIPEKQGLSLHDRELKNKQRKDNENPNRTSWKILEDERKIKGFSYLMRSDKVPAHGNFPPIWFEENGSEVIDALLSAQVEDLRPHGLERLGTYLIKSLYPLEPLYNSFGFKFDTTYSYEKILS